MKLIIAEKPSVAKSIASALGASSRADGFYEGSGLLVSWCVGHLVSPSLVSRASRSKRQFSVGSIRAAPSL